MGLDMYLYRREYVSGWENTFISDKPGMTDLYKSIVDYFEVDTPESGPFVYVDICVAYWRKANAIHKWFCDLDGGKDECQNIYVTREHLMELRNLCDSVLLQPATAQDILPTQPGCFFGSYDYDEWYMEDMKNTINQLDKILEATPEDGWADFIYRASW